MRKLGKAVAADEGDRRPWTEADARRVLAAWESSGESLAAFARGAGLVPQRLAWWRKRLGTTALTEPSASGPSFVPVELLGVPADGNAALVVTCDGLRLEIADVALVPPAWVAELVTALQAERP